MAVDTNTRFSNAIQGVPQVGATANIFQMDATPRFAVGTRLERQDGNEYVYSHFGTDVGPGKMVAQDITESSTPAIVMEVPSAAVNTSDGTIGSKFIECTNAAITADMFAGGYLSIEDDTGEGYTYRIKGNTATGNPGTSNYRIELYDKLQVAIVAATTGNIVGCLYSNLEVATATDTFAAGVSVSNVDFSEKPFAWVQTAGVATNLTTGTAVLGSGNILTAAGALAPAVESDILERVAVTLIVGATGEHSAYKLTLK